MFNEHAKLFCVIIERYFHQVDVMQIWRQYGILLISHFWHLHKIY